MNILNDLIYFTYIGADEELVIKEMYKADPELFISHLDQIFDIEFRNALAELIGAPKIEESEKAQQEINNIFTDIAHHFHAFISPEGREFWHSRGVTDDQIFEFCLGDNYIELPREGKKWPSIIETDYYKGLAKQHSPNYVALIRRAIHDQILTAQKLYGNGHAVCCPSFDNDGVCRGIVFLILHYKNNEHSLKNMFKFYNPFSWSYLFNYKTFENYDELIMVEGVFDALALQRAGYHNVISPSMVRLSPYHIRVLKDKKLHVLFDGDRGGLEGLKFIKDNFGDETNLLTLALCPTERDFDEMTQAEIEHFMDMVSQYDVRQLTSNPPPEHSIRKVS